MNADTPKSPSLQFYPKQWLGDDKVMLMDWDARGMHMHFICIAWQQQPPCTLPDDDNLLRKWVGNPPDWERLKAQIFRAWELENGRWIQPGLLRSYTKQKEYADSRRKNGAQRWKKNSQDAYASHTDCTRYEDEEEKNIPTDFSLENTEPPPKENLITRGSAVLAGQIYDAYPRHVAPDAARKSITKAIHRITREGRLKYVDRDGSIVSMPIENLNAATSFIQQATIEFAASPAGMKGEYVPYPTTWFNQGHYTDDRREWYRDEQPRNGNGNGAIGSRATSAHTVRTLTNLSAAERAIQRERERAKESETDNRSH